MGPRRRRASRRTGALMTLAGALPPTILADMLGISESEASRWYQLAGGEWGRYAARGVARYDDTPAS